MIPFVEQALPHNRSYLKKRILVQGVGGAGFQTADILRYFEDLKTGPNTQIGPKDFFEIASSFLYPANAEEAQQYRQRGLSYPDFRNLYLTPDGRHTMVVIKTRAVSALTADGLRLQGYARGVNGKVAHHAHGPQTSITQVENIAIIGIVEAVTKEYQAEAFSIAFSGTPVYQYHVEPMVRSNMKKVCIAILVFTLFSLPFSPYSRWSRALNAVRRTMRNPF